MTPDSGSAFLDALADEFLRRHRRGERPRIAHYIERYPEHADGIREVFPALVMLESIAKGPRHRSRYSLLAGVRRPEILGDYRILQEVGQGGMGIVYEAEQISLGRHVALKVLPFQLAGNPRAVQRFQREARAAANLQHPHIVPVFDFGQEESVWYYAMQFVHGQPVSDVLEEVRKLQGVEAFDLARWAGQTTDLAVTLIEGDFEGGDVPLESARGGAGAKSVFEADSADHREARIREIVDDCLVRSERGESVCHEDIVRQHPNLQPELEEELHMLRLVQASRLPSFVEDLAAMEARWAPPKERTETARAEDAQAPHGRTSEVGQSSSALKLTGEDDLAPAGRKQYYFHSVARLGAAVAGALAYAHEQGVIHRDVKPSNLMLDTRGHVWITDFGLAKLDDTKLTSTRGFVGTLRYMAPEQMQGRADERSDVYGLGMTLYEMLTLKLPFEDLDQLEVIHQACHRGPKPPREIDPAIPRDLETIVLTAIARDPVDRYPTARGLAEDLARFLEDQPIAAKRCGRITRAWKWLEVHIVGCFLTGRLLGGASPHTDSAQVAELHSRVRELEAEISKLQLRLKGGRDVDTDRAESVSASLEQVGKSDDRTRK